MIGRNIDVLHERASVYVIFKRINDYMYTLKYSLCHLIFQRKMVRQAGTLETPLNVEQVICDLV